MYIYTVCHQNEEMMIYTFRDCDQLCLYKTPTLKEIGLNLITDVYYEFHETCHSVTFYFMKKTPYDVVTPQRQSQFTPKMKANAESHLLSSLV